MTGSLCRNSTKYSISQINELSNVKESKSVNQRGKHISNKKMNDIKYYV